MFAHRFPSTVKYPVKALFTRTATASAQPPCAVSEPNGGPVPARSRGSDSAKELRRERLEDCERLRGRGHRVRIIVMASCRHYSQHTTHELTPNTAL